MAIEYVPEYDAAGIEIGGYTETVPDVHVEEEPNCSCAVSDDCPLCGSSQIDDALPFTVPAGGWPPPPAGYINEPPF